MLRALPMHFAPSRRTGQPPPGSPACGDATIERPGQLQRHKWSSIGKPMEESWVLVERRLQLDAAQNLDTRATETMRPSHHGGIGVSCSKNNAAHTVRDQRIDTGRSPACSGARFEGDVDRGPSGSPACSPKRHDLGVSAAGRLCPPLAYHRSIPNDNGADRRVRRRRAAAAERQGQRAPHEAAIGAQSCHRRAIFTASEPDAQSNRTEEASLIQLAIGERVVCRQAVTTERGARFRAETQLEDVERK